jgi:hypothetical protein
MRASALLALMGTAHAAIELTPDNFDTMVFDSGKAAFVKFLAPWYAAELNKRSRLRSLLRASWLPHSCYQRRCSDPHSSPRALGTGEATASR